MEPQPNQVSEPMNCQGMNDSGCAKRTAIPWEADILSGLLLGTLQSCPSRQAEGDLQLQLMG